MRTLSQDELHAVVAGTSQKSRQDLTRIGQHVSADPERPARTNAVATVSVTMIGSATQARTAHKPGSSKLEAAMPHAAARSS